MGYSLHNVTVGVKVLAAWWNEITFAIGHMDNRVLKLEALTPVESQDATGGSRAATTYAAVGSALTAACVVPQSGKVRVEIQCEMWAATAGLGMRTSAAISVSAGSGAAAASDVNSIKAVGETSGAVDTAGTSGSRSWVLSGLTAGATVTATMQHRCSAATIGNFINRRITVQPITGW